MTAVQLSLRTGRLTRVDVGPIVEAKSSDNQPRNQLHSVSPRAAWFVGVDLGALVGLVVLATSTRIVYAPVLWPVTMVADWLMLRRAGKEKAHRTQFVRGILEGYLIPVSIGLATFVVVGAYFLLTRGVIPE